MTTKPKFRNHLHRWLWMRRRRAVALLQGTMQRKRAHLRTVHNTAGCNLCGQIAEKIERQMGQWTEAQATYNAASRLGFIIFYDARQDTFIKM